MVMGAPPELADALGVPLAELLVLLVLLPPLLLHAARTHTDSTVRALTAIVRLWGVITGFMSASSFSVN